MDETFPTLLEVKRSAKTGERRAGVLEEGWYKKVCDYKDCT